MYTFFVLTGFRNRQGFALACEIIQVGETSFQVIDTFLDLAFLDDDKGFVLGKTAPMIAKYREHFSNLKGVNIFELGIRRGGSTAFFFEMFQPSCIAAIDIGPAALKLERWIEKRELGERVRSFYGVNQADAGRLNAIYEEVFEDRPLDFVMDDASHLFEETLASFNALFPRLRPGGAFVIEDWLVFESFRGFEAALPAIFHNTAPMSDLIKTIVAASGVSPHVVAEVVTGVAFVIVRRGDAVLGADFDIRSFA